MKLFLLASRLLSLRFVLALAFVLRVGVFAAAWWWSPDYSVFYSKDTATYLQPAAALLATGSFTSAGAPEILRTPGYPLLLVIGLQFGYVELVTILLQILLSCGTCYLVFSITRQVFLQERAAVFAALLLSLEPLSILYSCLLLSDTLFVFLLAASLHWLIRACQHGRFVDGLLAALVLAAAIYTRPVGYFFPLVLALALSVWAVVKKERKLLLQTAVCCVLTMSLVGLWQLRNQLATGYAGFSATSETVLYFYHAGAVKAQQQGKPFYQVVEELGYYDAATYFRQHPEQQTWSPGQRYAYLRNEGVKSLSQAPGLYAQVYGRGILVMLFDPGVVEYLKLFRQYKKSDRVLNVMAKQGLVGAAQRVLMENPSLLGWGSLLGLLLLSLYFLGFVGLRGKPMNLPLVILFCACGYFLTVSGGIVAVSRFRAPLMPMICVFAGQGLAVAVAWAKAKNLGRNRFGLALNVDAR